MKDDQRENVVEEAAKEVAQDNDDSHFPPQDNVWHTTRKPCDTKCSDVSPKSTVSHRHDPSGAGAPEPVEESNTSKYVNANQHTPNVWNAKQKPWDTQEPHSDSQEHYPNIDPMEQQDLEACKESETLSNQASIDQSDVESQESMQNDTSESTQHEANELNTTESKESTPPPHPTESEKDSDSQKDKSSGAWTISEPRDDISNSSHQPEIREESTPSPASLSYSTAHANMDSPTRFIAPMLDEGMVSDSHVIETESDEEIQLSSTDEDRVSKAVLSDAWKTKHDSSASASDTTSSTASSQQRQKIEESGIISHESNGRVNFKDATIITERDDVESEESDSVNIEQETPTSNQEKVIDDFIFGSAKERHTSTPIDEDASSQESQKDVHSNSVTDSNISISTASKKSSTSLAEANEVDTEDRRHEAVEEESTVSALQGTEAEPLQENELSDARSDTEHSETTSKESTLQLMHCVDGKIEISDEAVETIRQNFSQLPQGNPLYVVSVSGNARLGKSTFQNLFLLASDKKQGNASQDNSTPERSTPDHRNIMFRAGAQIDTLTRGLWVHPHPIQFNDGNALLVDCEGLDLNDDHATGLLYLFAMLFSSTFTIHDTKTLHNRTLSQLALSLQLLKEFETPQVFMPTVVFVLRDTAKLSWDGTDSSAEVILERIFSETNSDVKLINQCLDEKYLTHLPPPTSDLPDTGDIEELYSVVKDTPMYKLFESSVFPLLKKVSRPKTHPKSSLCMSIDELIAQMFKIRELCNSNQITKIPTALEAHVFQKCEGFVKNAEDEFESTIGSLYTDSTRSSKNIQYAGEQQLRRCMENFSQQCSFLEDNDLKKTFEPKLAKTLEKILDSYKDAREKEELKESLLREKRRRIQLEKERVQTEELYREERRRRLAEKAKQLKRSQIEQDKNQEREWENSEIYGQRENSPRRYHHQKDEHVVWKNRGVLMKGTVRRHTVGPIPKTTRYLLRIRNLSEPGLLTSKNKIEPTIVVRNDRIPQMTQIDTEETFHLDLQKGDEVKIELRVLSSMSWKKWMGLNGTSVEYDVRLEVEQ